MSTSIQDLNIKLDKIKIAFKSKWNSLSNSLKKKQGLNSEIIFFSSFFDLDQIKKEFSEQSDKLDIEKSNIAYPENQIPPQIQNIFTKIDKINKRMEEIHWVLYSLEVVEKLKPVIKEIDEMLTPIEMGSVNNEAQRFLNTWRDFKDTKELFADMIENLLVGFDQGTEGGALPELETFTPGARDCQKPPLRMQLRFISNTNSTPRSESENRKLNPWDLRGNPTCSIPSGDADIECKEVEKEKPEAEKQMLQSLPDYVPAGGNQSDNPQGHRRTSTFPGTRALQVEHQEQDPTTLIQGMQQDRAFQRRNCLNPAPARPHQDPQPEPRIISPLVNHNRPIEGGFYSSIGESSLIECGKTKDSPEADFQANWTFPSAKLNPQQVDSQTHHPGGCKTSSTGKTDDRKMKREFLTR